MHVVAARAGKRLHDPYWQPAAPLAESGMRAWLLQQGSLTARIASRCRDFNVRLLFQGRARVAHEEASLLGLRSAEHACGRDVLLCCGADALVYGHSVLRYADLRGGWRVLAGWGAQPLGHALFSDARIERSPFAFRRLGAMHPLYCAAARAVGRALQPLWARRSLFWSGAAPLLVTEVFLPAIVGLPS